VNWRNDRHGYSDHMPSGSPFLGLKGDVAMRRTVLFGAIAALLGAGIAMPTGIATADTTPVTAKPAVTAQTTAKPAATNPTITAQAPTSNHPTRHACGNPAPGLVACTAIVRTDYAKPAVVTTNGTTITPAVVAG